MRLFGIAAFRICMSVSMGTRNHHQMKLHKQPLEGYVSSALNELSNTLLKFTSMTLILRASGMIMLRKFGGFVGRENQVFLFFAFGIRSVGGR